MIYLSVDEGDVIRFVQQSERGLSGFPPALARELQADLIRESAPASRRVAASWRVVGAGGALDVHTDVPWASFLARGTQPHGPVGASVLHFEVDGEEVYALSVAGIPPDPFDVRAVTEATVRAGSVLQATLVAAGVA